MIRGELELEDIDAMKLQKLQVKPWSLLYKVLCRGNSGQITVIVLVVKNSARRSGYDLHHSSLQHRMLLRLSEQ